DEPIAAARLVENRSHDCQRVVDVFGDQLPVAVFDGRSRAQQRPKLRVVIGAAGDGLLKDRRVRGDAPDTTIDPALQLTTGDPSALEIVEPRALTAAFEQLAQPVHSALLTRWVTMLTCLRQPTLVYRSPSSLRAFATTFSRLMPSFSSTKPPGADAPKRSIQTVASA